MYIETNQKNQNSKVEMIDEIGKETSGSYRCITVTCENIDEN